MSEAWESTDYWNHAEAVACLAVELARLEKASSANSTGAETYNEPEEYILKAWSLLQKAYTLVQQNELGSKPPERRYTFQELCSGKTFKVGAATWIACAPEGDAFRELIKEHSRIESSRKLSKTHDFIVEHLTENVGALSKGDLSSLDILARYLFSTTKLPPGDINDLAYHCEGSLSCMKDSTTWAEDIFNWWLAKIASDIHDSLLGDARGRGLLESDVRALITTRLLRNKRKGRKKVH